MFPHSPSILIATICVVLSLACAGISDAWQQDEDSQFDGAATIDLIEALKAETNQTLQQSPPQANAWWLVPIRSPTRRAAETQELTLEDLIRRTLAHSAQIQTFQELPLIRETAIVEADATFDWTKYFNTFWNDTSDPVGSFLATGGGPSRFSDHNLYGSAGLRQRNIIGGQVDISQRLGHQNTNSNFFIPADQGSARLTLSYTQPLLRGRGKFVNRSIIVLACFDKDIATEELSRQLQSHLLEVTRAYWGLYLERGNLAQRIRLYQRGVDILANLRARQRLDTSRAQFVRVQAAVADRRSQLLRAENAVRNSEARIRALVNDMSLGNANNVELIPLETPSSIFVTADTSGSVARAIQNRPEIHQAMKRIRAGCVRLNVARNDLLPELNLIAQTYVSGLRGESNIGRAFEDQFTRGAPTYSVGVEYAFPIGNRAAEARKTRRELEIRQLKSQFRTTSATIAMEAKVAVGEVKTTYTELATKHQSMRATADELAYIKIRWQHLTGADGKASLVLDNLLRAQDRLADSEYEYLNSLVTYNLAITNLKRAEGMLLQAEGIECQRGCECGLPTLQHMKGYHIPNESTPGLIHLPQVSSYESVDATVSENSTTPIVPSSPTLQAIEVLDSRSLTTQPRVD